MTLFYLLPYLALAYMRFWKGWQTHPLSSPPAPGYMQFSGKIMVFRFPGWYSCMTNQANISCVDIQPKINQNQPSMFQPQNEHVLHFKRSGNTKGYNWLGAPNGIAVRWFKQGLLLILNGKKAWKLVTDFVVWLRDLGVYVWETYKNLLWL